MTKPVRVGVIGAGIFAQNNQIPCLLAHPEVQVVWACDSNPRRLKQIRSMYDLEGLPAENVDQGLKQVDIVLLSVPYGLRDKYYELCARSGLAVYVEKPFARTVEEQEHEHTASQFPEGFLTIGFNRRAYRNTFALGLACSNNMFGRLKKILVRQGFSKLSGYSGYRLDASLAGGGVLIESGIHLVDTVVAITHPTSFVIEDVKMMSEDGRDYHTQGFGMLDIGSHSVKLCVQISSLQNFASGIWFEFDCGILHYPISPEEPVTIRDNKNRIIGRLELDVDGALTVPKSLKRTWDGCIASYRHAKPSRNTPAKTLITTHILEQLYDGSIT